MSEKTEAGINIEFPKPHGTIQFESPQKLREWYEQTRNEWAWLASTPARTAWEPMENLFMGIRQASDDWGRLPENAQHREQTKALVKKATDTLFDSQNVLFGNVGAREFLKQVKAQFGQMAAAGALSVLNPSPLQIDRDTPGAFFVGLIRGFLFQNEIDWTATAHRKLLEELQADYAQSLRDQENRLKQIEAANSRLNDSHDRALQEKSAQLDNVHQSKITSLDKMKETKERLLEELHSSQERHFIELAAKHEANLKSIEDTFHNKLALQKPIDYWKEKRAAHIRLAKIFAWSSTITLAILGGSLSCLVYWAFGNLGASESPKHWQLGVVIIAAFFAIWIVRILVRLLLSHQHLASDASERVTMVQTYLSLTREGEGFSPADRTVILQQLFRSASDGIVKDDAAPPGILELASRDK